LKEVRVVCCRYSHLRTRSGFCCRAEYGALASNRQEALVSRVCIGVIVVGPRGVGGRRDNRRAELHYSQLDDLEEHLDKTNTPRSLVTAIIRGITGWYRNPNYQIPLSRRNPISPNTVLRQALTDQNAIGWGRMYYGQISQDFQTVHNVDRPHGSHDRHANAATLSDWTSKLITLLFVQ
jgi:hypothetical protein